VSCQRLSRWSSPTSSLGFAYRCTRHACWVIRIQLDNRSDIGKEQWSIHDLCEAIRELPRNLDMARFDEMMRGSYDIVALNCRHERGTRRKGVRYNTLLIGAMLVLHSAM